MAGRELLPIFIGSSGAGLILLLTLPSMQRLFRSRSPSAYDTLSNGHDINSLYEDDDGTATPHSEAAYSDRVVKINICVATSLGFAASLASAVLSTVLAKTLPTQLLLFEDWINFAVWVCAPG